jgi:hypothetical protein
MALSYQSLNTKGCKSPSALSDLHFMGLGYWSLNNMGYKLRTVAGDFMVLSYQSLNTMGCKSPTTLRDLHFMAMSYQSLNTMGCKSHTVVSDMVHLLPFTVNHVAHDLERLTLHRIGLLAAQYHELQVAQGRGRHDPLVH